MACTVEEEICTDCPVADVDLYDVYHTVLDGVPVVIGHSSSYGLSFSFRRVLDGDTLDFNSVNTRYPAFAKDQYGTTWDVFGVAIRGPQTGRSLTPLHGGYGYWFCWSSIFPSIRLGGEALPLDTTVLTDDDWIVDANYVNRGAATDAIQSLDNPVFEKLSNREILRTSILEDDDEIILVKQNEEIKAYPVKILNYHEVVNDYVGGLPIAVTYSPYSGSAGVLSRKVDGDLLEFGVSGLVYNNNLLLYDRPTKSYWSQLLGKCVNGAYVNAQLDVVPHVQVKWSKLKEWYWEHTMLAIDQGFDIDYGIPVLPDYESNNEYLPFPIAGNDGRRARKAIVYGCHVEEDAYAID